MPNPFAPKLFLKTRDLDQAASELSTTAIPYVSELLPGSPAFSTQIRVAQGRDLRLSWVTTTGALRVQSRLPSDSFAVVLDLRKGVGLHRGQGQCVVVDSECSFIHSPLQPVEVITRADFEVLFLRIRRDALLHELQNLLGRPVQAGLVFASAFRMQSAAGRGLRALCGNLGCLLDSSSAFEEDLSHTVRQFENEIITLLLQAQSHNYTRLLNRRSDAGDWQLKAAEEYIRAHAHLPLTLGDISLAAGVNARTLQYSFRKRRGHGPMRFLRKIRMEEVHAALLQPDEATTVTNAAAHWGFVHFGRFSNEYRAHFGELPSETLRQSRNRVGTQTDLPSIA